MCVGGWVDETTTHEEKGENRREESKKKIKSTWHQLYLSTGFLRE